MRFSRSLKSSTQSLPSPDGTYIATVFPSKLSIRETRSLETTRVFSLPAELVASINWFLWSASSTRLLLASANEIRVFSTVNKQFSATISNPTSGSTRAVFVLFGSSEDEVCVFSEFGLKLSIYNLSTSKSVEINAPKFYNPGVAPKGLAYRPRTLNLTLLTRSGGKDIISIHERDTLEVTRSWCPDTVDAQGISWSPDGRWLTIWESASQGHKMQIYAADGYLYKTWGGPILVTEEDEALALGPGIKLCDWNKTGTLLAVADYSNRVIVLAIPAFTESMNLVHTATVKPTQSLQVWQEQIVQSQNGRLCREFVPATQLTCPPTSNTAPPSDANARTGTNLLSFDNTGTLLATRTENMPTTIWVWDVGNRTLRAVMIFHAPIAKATWHPTIDELLLIRCEGDESRALVHLWDPAWSCPKIIDFAMQLPGGKVLGKTVARWLDIESATPAVFFSDSQDCLLASVAGPEDSPVPWETAQKAFDIYGNMEESPLNLVPAHEKRPYSRVDSLLEDDSLTRLSGGSDEVDDTFHFRKFVEPARTNLLDS